MFSYILEKLKILLQVYNLIIKVSQEAKSYFFKTEIDVKFG